MSKNQTIVSDSLVHAVAGAAGGMISMTLTYPLITISTRSQVETKENTIKQIQTMKNILENEGFQGLFAGLKSALFGISITQAIYYYWYELLKSGFETGKAAGEAITVAENMLTGAIAGSVTSLLTNPIWIINVFIVLIRHAFW